MWSPFYVNHTPGQASTYSFSITNIELSCIWKANQKPKAKANPEMQKYKI